VPAKLFATSAARSEPLNAGAESHRAELLAHCYRMLGSLQDAEDVLQETFSRAWKARDAFDARSTLRTWLYRIATHLCLDELRRAKVQRRELPVQGGVAIRGDDATPASVEPERWLTPFPDALLGASANEDPEAKYLSAESVRLAFIASLQRLTGPQRAVLLLRDVLGWAANDAAEALGMTTAAVNSALHRARQLTRGRPRRAAAKRLSTSERQLLERYVRAWEARDTESLAGLLASGATFSMPPNPAFLRGRPDVIRYLRRVVLAPGTERRFVWTRANGGTAFGIYARREGSREPFRPHSLQVVSLARGRVADIVSFRDVSVFPRFELPGQK
jgi:RNA polymerase sigma-70 factor (ECF subfamily)